MNPLRNYLIFHLSLMGSLWISTAPVRPDTPNLSQPSTAQEAFFEKTIRPILVDKCLSCHGPEKTKGGLRLDTAQGLAKGGDSGPVLIAGQPDKSLLIQAVKHQGELRMPPSGKLPQTAIENLERWVKSGGHFPPSNTKEPKPGNSPTTTSAESPLLPLPPDDASIRSYLQSWYKADTLPLTDGEPVWVWPDSSRFGRDLSVTKGVRQGGVGTPPRFAQQSGLRKRPAVHFEPGNGMAASPANPVDIVNDSGFTLFVVMRLTEHKETPPFDGVIGIGDPANPSNPGKPKAALVQIQRTADAELQLAGGWGNDASLGSGSFRPYFNKSLILGVRKSPGPWTAKTDFLLNGKVILASSLKGNQALPQIAHRSDIGLYIGKALGWSGSIKGDIGEIAVFNRDLATDQMQRITRHFSDKFGIMTQGNQLTSPTVFSAKEKSHWAFAPLRPNPSGVTIDSLIDDRLKKAGLEPNPAADKRSLIRRLSFDLTGLPPRPEEVDAFEKDQSPQAYSRLVDQLLASPAYGEKQARSWLDLVRYAESTANDANAVMRFAWRYRDYVIQAFQKDLPYDRFILEQLAGDLLEDGSDPRKRVPATGILMVGAKALAETDKEQSRLDIIDDQIDVIGRAFLGMTLACARCHDHKFDPISTNDYYALAGILRSTEVFRDEVRNASMWQEWPIDPKEKNPLIVMAPKEGMPVDLRIHLRGNRFSLGKVAPRGFPAILNSQGTILDTDQSGRLELARFIASGNNPLTARVMANRIWQNLMGKGLVGTSDNFGFRGEAPTHPELLDTLASQFITDGWSIKKLTRAIVLSAAYQRNSHPQEKALLLDPDNRLLWRHTPRRLQAEEIRDAMLLVSGQLDSIPGGSESGEFLYNRGEVIDKNRDFFRPNQVKADDPYYLQSRKRTIYLPVVRNAVPDFLTLFDGADPNGVTAFRNDTTVPSQALFLMNHPFPRQQALAFAKEILARKDLDPSGKIDWAFTKALGRSPCPEEISAALTFLNLPTNPPTTGSTPAASPEVLWQDFAQTLLCRNEFLYLP